MGQIYPFTVKPANDTEEFYHVLRYQKEIAYMHASIGMMQQLTLRIAARSRRTQTRRYTT